MSENAKDNAVQQAQTWAQEARTQRATVLEILRYFGLPERDWEALSLIKAKLGDVPPAAAPAVQTELTEHRINELAWETFKSDPRTLFATRCQEFARSIEREVRSLLSGTRTCVQAGDSQTQEIAHLAASQASRTSGDAATNAPSAAGSDSAAGVAVPPQPEAYVGPVTWTPDDEARLDAAIAKRNAARAVRGVPPSDGGQQG